ncbi:3-oxoacyl-[acyl-carrier-protein] synthase II [Streptomyces sp. V4I8]|uniref:beta-ketoacyl-[acyl-carrier-protein] synthase family protein n=1 Tax=Streptomyces sp. V4I8 TaxID=3156469 RepID=UPI00351872B0
MSAIAVTGIGLVSPAGMGREESWRRVCDGLPTAAADPQLDGLPVSFSCRVPGFNAAALLGASKAWRYDRCTQMGLVAAHEAVADAQLAPEAWRHERVAVVVGTAFGGAGTYDEQHCRFLKAGAEGLSPMMLTKYLPNMLAGHIALSLSARGPSQQVSTACASGITAIGTAMAWLRSGVCDIALAGAADAAVTPLLVAAFARIGALSRRNDNPLGACRPFDAGHDGFVMGEGAGMLVLERAEDARARGRPGYALLVGYGASCDAHHAVAPHPEGRGAEAAIRAALADAGADPAEVDHVNAHGTSTPLNDSIESMVISRVLPQGPSVTSTKGVTGHLLGGAGAVEAAFTALTVARCLVPPTANLQHIGPEIAIQPVGKQAIHQHVELALNNSFGFGGHNAVVAFRPAPE